eukprot:PhM_4_TR7745/c0_g1_i1/m.49935
MMRDHRRHLTLYWLRFLSNLNSFRCTLLYVAYICIVYLCFAAVDDYWWPRQQQKQLQRNIPSHFTAYAESVDPVSRGLNAQISGLRFELLLTLRNVSSCQRKISDVQKSLLHNLAKRSAMLSDIDILSTKKDRIVK